MKTFVTFLIAGVLMLSNCSRLQPQEPDASFSSDFCTVEVRDNYILFSCTDHPSITSDLPGDKYEMSSKRGRYNASRAKRCRTNVQKTLVKLEKIVKEAETELLLNSLQSGYDGEIDYYLSLFGNWIIAEELSNRRPIDKNLFQKYDNIIKRVFLGHSGPVYFDLDGLLRMAHDRIKHRTN